MREVGVDTFAALHRWSVEHRADYWRLALARLQIRLRQPYTCILDPASTPATPRWLPGAALNIVESCFAAPDESAAIIFQEEGGSPRTMTVRALRELTGRVAAGLAASGFAPGDAVAILLPMTAEAVAIYLGIIQAGCVAVGIADSFQPKEIAVRLRLSGAVVVFTQDVLPRGGRTWPLYGNLQAAHGPRAIVLAAGEELCLPLRDGDVRWRDFLAAEPRADAVERQPSDALNILFSSGTTGEPKAIPWTQITPLKCAADAHFHQDVRPGDVLAWPTNLGWMMGPWLVFASLLNRATMALFYGAPTGAEFRAFVAAAHVTLLGVIPSLVRAWRHSAEPGDVDWSGLRAFSSTGECSSAADMRWLMAQAGGRPVIEYCGGTEIGGAYITGSMTVPCIPGTFNTPALGSDFVILDETGAPSTYGELFLIPPSIGWSERLLHRDHAAVYLAGVPAGPHGETLRRHGDEMEQVAPGYWRGHGRADDTMNLGGIKVSSAEIERVVLTVPGVVEAAAVAVPPEEGGPGRLILYAVAPGHGEHRYAALLTAMQDAIKRELNPLFKIHEVRPVDSLPRTASHKVMRRELRVRAALRSRASQT
jgi:acetyl-CoA synthetase